MDYAIYVKLTGEIRRILSAPASMVAANTQADELAMECDIGTDALYRVNVAATPHVLVAKSPLPFYLDKPEIVADGFDEATITGIPGGATAEYEGIVHAVPDGVVEFSADVPGEYEIALKHPLYLPSTATVTAT